MVTHSSKSEFDGPRRPSNSNLLEELNIIQLVISSALSILPWFECRTWNQNLKLSLISPYTWIRLDDILHHSVEHLAHRQGKNASGKSSLVFLRNRTSFVFLNTYVSYRSLSTMSKNKMMSKKFRGQCQK